MYRALQTTTLLGGEGEGGEIKANRVNCPKSFDSPIVVCRYFLEF